MNDFFPNDYETPSSGSGAYTKFTQGENRIRILSKPLVGVLYWVDASGNPVAKGAQPQSGNKPVRVPYGSAETLPHGADVKHFQAFVVWNYQDNEIQIMELTQKGLMRTVTDYARNPKWGDPREYDFKITRKGSGLETEYSVMVDPKEAIDPGLKKAYEDMGVDLNQLFAGGDPFNPVKTTKEEKVDESDIPF